MTEIIQSSYLIKKPPQGRIIGKVDMTCGYMKEDIGYSIILLSKVMGLPAASHLSTFMVNFIKTIKTTRMPLDWATTLSENLCKQLAAVKDKKKFYMTSYMVYLLVERAAYYLGLYKSGNIRILMHGHTLSTLNW